MADDRNDAAGYLGWFFLGGVVGAATALDLGELYFREVSLVPSPVDSSVASRSSTMSATLQ